MYLELDYDGRKKVIKKDLICYISSYVSEFHSNDKKFYNIDITFVGGETCYISSENEKMILCIWKKLKENLCIE